MAMGAGKNIGRAVVAPLAFLNLFMFAVVLGLSGWMVNRAIGWGGFQFGGNAVTPYLALFSLLAAMVGVASAVTAMHHVRVGTSSSAAAAQATSWITWMLLVLAFCLAWKEIRIGGRTLRHRTLESFVIVLTATKFAETLAYYFDGDKKRADSSNTPPTSTYSSTV